MIPRILDIPAFKKKLEISSRPNPLEVLNLLIASITCLDTTGEKIKVALVGLMVYSPFRRPFSVSGISLHNSLPTLQKNSFIELAIPTESVTELPSTVSDDVLVVLDLLLTSLLIVAQVSFKFPSEA